MLTFRIAKPEDSDELLRIYKYYVENTAITFEFSSPTVEEFKRRIYTTLEKYPYIVAVNDGKIVGFAYASRFKARPAYNWAIETSIYVDKQERRGGIGRLLYKKLEKILILQQVHNANACIVSTDIENERVNNDSIHFHCRVGYSMVGKFHKIGSKFDQWYDMVCMEKELLPHDAPPNDFIPFPMIIDQVKQLLKD